MPRWLFVSRACIFSSSFFFLFPLSIFGRQRQREKRKKRKFHRAQRRTYILTLWRVDSILFMSGSSESFPTLLHPTFLLGISATCLWNKKKQTTKKDSHTYRVTNEVGGWVGRYMMQFSCFEAERDTEARGDRSKPPWNSVNERVCVLIEKTRLATKRWAGLFFRSFFLRFSHKFLIHLEFVSSWKMRRRKCTRGLSDPSYQCWRWLIGI